MFLLLTVTANYFMALKSIGITAIDKLPLKMTKSKERMLH